MESEKVVCQVRDTNDKLVEIYEGAMLEKLSDSESKEIRDKVARQYPEFSRLRAAAVLKLCMFKECKLRMNERERFIYENGVAHGRKSALYWVLGDIDDMFEHD
jgi:hypothetical protein